MVESNEPIEIDSKVIRRALKRFPQAFGREARGAFRIVGSIWMRRMQSKFVPYSEGGQPAGGPIQSRTGDLRSSIFSATEPSGTRHVNPNRLRLFLTAGTPYAATQEFGATITPKNKEFLTVPLPDALTEGGALSGQALLREEDGRFVTDLGPTFIVGDGNQLTIVLQDGLDLIPLYALVRKVVIPGPKSTGDKSRLGMHRVADETIEGKGNKPLAQRLGEAAARAWRNRGQA
jgi:hypothetical protein